MKANSVKKPSDEVWIGYCGTLGVSYDLIVVIEALKILKKQGEKTPRLVVMGNGERMVEFEKAAADLDCIFTGRLPYNRMCGMLSACDIAVNPIIHNATQSIIKKTGDYAAAGLPVINTQECQEYRDLVDEYHMGINCRNSDAMDVSMAIEHLVEDEHLRMKMAGNARRCAEERFDRTLRYMALERVIIGV